MHFGSSTVQSSCPAKTGRYHPAVAATRQVTSTAVYSRRCSSRLARSWARARRFMKSSSAPPFRRSSFNPSAPAPATVSISTSCSRRFSSPPDTRSLNTPQISGSLAKARGESRLGSHDQSVKTDTREHVPLPNPVRESNPCCLVGRAEAEMAPCPRPPRRGVSYGRRMGSCRPTSRPITWPPKPGSARRRTLRSAWRACGRCCD
jgi:hypothetical protein